MIERELGRGGMARVFLARDLKHERQVAIKVLRPELTEAIGIERFLREIRVTATLQHPHILPLHDSGEVEGLLFYVMPFVEGATLRSRLSLERRLPVAEVVAITRALGGALDYAHGRGVVHRDIKPENILFSGGHPMLADFGIASASGAERVTATGVSVGTPQYMSPEQIDGNKTVGPPTDVYALAAVAYEMLTGEPPFIGASAQAILRQGLMTTPKAVHAIRPDVPEQISAAILQGLEKVPEDRFPSAGAFAQSLSADAASAPARTSRAGRNRKRAWQATALIAAAALATGGVLWNLRPPAGPVLDRDVVAVLPFRVTASDSSHNYLREGAVDILNAQLTGDGVPRSLDTRLVLNAWRRIQRRDGDEPTLDEARGVARQLGAGRAIIGEYVARPDGITLTARMIDVDRGTTVATHSEPTNDDALQLTSRVLNGLLATALGEARDRLSRLSDSMPAIRAYLLGMREYRQGRLDSAQSQFRRALEIDSSFVAAAFWWSTATPTGGGPFKREADRALWTRREGLSRKDKATVSTLWSIGPRYPHQATIKEFLDAHRMAANANPDRPEPWLAWGTALADYGPQAGVLDYRERAARALDHAIALDSTHVPTLSTRLQVAVAMKDSARVRGLAKLYFAFAPPEGASTALNRWLVANALGDSSELAAARLEIGQPNGPPSYALLAFSVELDFPLGDLDERLRDVPNEKLRDAPNDRFDLAAIRGRQSDALAMADSLRNGGNLVARAITSLVTLALLEPGYDEAAQRAFRHPRAFTNRDYPVSGYEAHAFRAYFSCYTELANTLRGDTRRTRPVAMALRRLMRDSMGVGLFAGVGPLEVCPLLLEAAIDQKEGRLRDPTAMKSLDSLMRLGAGRDLTAVVANVLLARWHEDRGEYRQGLAAARRRINAGHRLYYLAAPAYLRAEGRLAALAGDTVGAVRAYERFLALRDQPDPGPMQEQVAQVRAHLAQLTGDARRSRTLP